MKIALRRDMSEYKNISYCPEPGCNGLPVPEFYKILKDAYSGSPQLREAAEEELQDMGLEGLLTFREQRSTESVVIQDNAIHNPMYMPRSQKASSAPLDFLKSLNGI